MIYTLRSRVRIVDAHIFGPRDQKELEGREGMVMANGILSGSNYIRVKLDGGNCMLFKPSEIEVIV